MWLFTRYLSRENVDSRHLVLQLLVVRFRESVELFLRAFFIVGKLSVGTGARRKGLQA